MTQALLRDRFGFGELALGVDAAHVVLLRFDRDRLERHVARNLDGIGQIEFLLAIRVANSLQDCERGLPGEGHEPAVAKIDRPLVRTCIGFLANGQELAVFDDEPSIPRRIRRPKGEDRERCAGRQRRSQPGERGRPDQGGVAVNNQNVVGAPLDGGLCGKHRVGGPAPRLLHEMFSTGQNALRLLGNGILAWTDHNRG